MEKFYIKTGKKKEDIEIIKPKKYYIEQIFGTVRSRLLVEFDTKRKAEEFLIGLVREEKWKQYEIVAGQ